MTLEAPRCPSCGGYGDDHAEQCRVYTASVWHAREIARASEDALDFIERAVFGDGQRRTPGDIVREIERLRALIDGHGGWREAAETNGRWAARVERELRWLREGIRSLAAQYAPPEPGAAGYDVEGRVIASDLYALLCGLDADVAA